MKLTHYIKTWYLRTLPTIDLDNDGQIIAPMQEKDWTKSVYKDLRKILKEYKNGK